MCDKWLRGKLDKGKPLAARWENAHGVVGLCGKSI